MKLRNAVVALTLVFPNVLLAYSTGPVIQRTGAAIDGGTDCTACHRTFSPANSDTRGGVFINTVPYTPGVKQMVMVTVMHPLQKRWGFQLIARAGSDEKQQAGSFTVDSVVRVRCDNTNDAPCNGAVEYAEHKSAPITEAGAGYTFQVTWTPPETDIGEVHFYAAGNAADGNGSPTNDRIYTTKTFIQPAGKCNLSQVPQISDVVNGGSFAPGISPGSMVSIFGSGFNLPGSRYGASPTANAFPRQFSCVAVELNGTRVPVTYVGESQLNVQAPANLAAGPVSVRVLLNPDLSNQLASTPATATAQAMAPSLFTFGVSSAAATVPNSATPIADADVVATGVAAKPGDMISLWGTGFGLTSPASPEGAIVSSKATVTGTVAVSIGGVSLAAADIVYAGLSPGSISGLYQLNVRVPAGLPDGNAKVVASVAGASTQDGLSIPVHQ